MSVRHDVLIGSDDAQVCQRRCDWETKRLECSTIVSSDGGAVEDAVVYMTNR